MTVGKECTRCGGLRSLESYRKSKYHSSGIHNICRPCEAEYTRNYYQKLTPTERSLINRKSHLNKFGLKPDDVPKVGVCPICENEKRLVIDHCHDQGHFRDFICYSCNSLLGHIENKHKMTKVREYLAKHRRVNEPEA